MILERMRILKLISTEHLEVIKKCHRLEIDLIRILQSELKKDESEVTMDFLKFYRTEIINHFKLEEEAVFPVLWSVFKKERQLIRVLLADHQDITKRYLKLENFSKRAVRNQTEALLDLLKNLLIHAFKEEITINQLILGLDERHLKKIEERARKLI
jgi:hypothetical protein